MRLSPPSPGLLRRWAAERPAPRRVDRFSSWGLHALVVDDAETGLLGLGLGEHGKATAVLAELWIAPERRGNGHAREAVALVEKRVREAGVDRVRTSTPPGGAASKLFAAWPITSRNMALEVVAAPTPPEGVEARPMSPEAFREWRAHEAEDFADSLARTGVSRADALDETRRQMAELLPQGRETPDHEFWTFHAQGAQAAMLWINIQRDAGRVFIFNVSVHPDHRGAGHGRTAVRHAEARAAELGIAEVGLHVFADNTPADRLYRTSGYRVEAEHRAKVLAAAAPAEGG